MRVQHLTIMFTDIAGYTALGRRIGHRELERVLAECEAIVRAEAEQQHAGRIVKNIGDSFLIVYQSARDALLAAAAIQGAIAARNRRVPTSQALALKIAINVGDVSVDERGDVFGDPVNVCARMEKVAAGGEILFSEAVYHCVNKAEHRFEEFGNYDFKGVDRPVKIFRLDTSREGSAAVERAIVFTDIVGFNRLIERDLEAGERLLELHDGALFPSVTRHGGTIQNVISDECLLTFERTDDGVSCMLDFFDELARHNAGAAEADRLLVKASLHWGRVQFIRGRALGEAVNYCALLERQGTSLALIASQTARDHLGPRADVSIVDVGVVNVPGAATGSLPCYLVRRAS